MFDLISIGNISIDLFFRGDCLTFKNNRFQLAIGGKYTPDHFYESVGGGGANVAIGARNLGLRSGVMGKIGNNPFKHLIYQKLSSSGVDHTLCDIVPNYINISSILLATSGDRSVIHYVTPHQHFLSAHLAIRRITNTKYVYFGNLEDVSLTEREHILKMLYKHKITRIVNLGVKDCRRHKIELERFLQNVDILILNGHEFAELVKAPFPDIHFREDIVKWYIPSLSKKIIVVTLGEVGSYAYISGTIYRQIAFKPKKILDTTGAGDGYTAGFISEFIYSHDIKKSMEKGARYAVKILEKIGAN